MDGSVDVPEGPDQSLLRRIAVKNNSLPTGDHVFAPSRKKVNTDNAKGKKKQLSALDLQRKPRGMGDTKTKRKNEPPEKRGGVLDSKGKKKLGQKLLQPVAKSGRTGDSTSKS
jgi:hypothetical protein